MKTEKEVEDMRSFIGFFNDGIFMNQDYRRGALDALAFVLYPSGNLERMKLQILSLGNENKIIKERLDEVKKGKVLTTKELRKKRRLIEI